MIAESGTQYSGNVGLTSLAQPYIQFRLDPNSMGLLTTEYAREVVDVPVQRLTPIPNMPAPMLGLMNWRSLAIWAIDLPHLLGCSRLGNTTQHYHMMMIRAGQTPLALAVPEIEGVARLQPEQIISPVGMTPAGIVPFLQGCVLEHRQVLLVLDALAIAQALEPTLN